MQVTLTLSPNTLNTTGIILLTIVAVEYGGWFMLRAVRGRQPATPFQQAFFRAGHAHAAVLLVLALVGQILADAAHMSGVLADLSHAPASGRRLFSCPADSSFPRPGKASPRPIDSSCCSTLV